ncbi:MULTISPECIES: helicase C-terminal domain-containing protein [Olsenella]|uniref:helicase C-terminal domain-containing protein n=1 Tax=Olsenella TaxID=133925 RepID=UPI0007805B5E|nr:MULTISPECIES: helicase C-terminal domain-containing protein [Olsenella]KXB61826.1 DnaQ family exonuclease/DinG family helicase [Olsenella sp. DNF00959]
MSGMGPLASPVDEILLPGTPEEVAERYRSLERRATKTSFDLLEEDIVVLDTETTGLSFKGCELIEVAAARLSGREVVERFHSFVHPHRPIPSEISALTGISNADVALAPEAPDVIGRLADFVGGVPVLAHNATFDRTFVESVPGGKDVSDSWIDTLALSRIALPRLSTHRLADMAHAFGCDAVTHRAMADVDALCGMWRVILLGLSDLGPGLLGRLADMHPEVDWPFRPVIGHLSQEQGQATFSLRQARRDLLAGERPAMRTEAPDGGEELVSPSSEEVTAQFRRGGLVERMYPSFEWRQEQEQMALEVRDALASSSHRSIEAGTGVGKSMAYLLPELMFAQRNRLTVGVATKSNALTDQLISQELPALARVLPDGLSFTSLKGYDHYPCLHRLETSTYAELPLSLVDGMGKSPRTTQSEMLTAIAVSYAFCLQSPQGDLDALGIRWRYVPRQMLSTTANECLRNRCPFYPNECLVHGARKRASQSDVVVTNHSLLLRDIDLDGQILPPISHWVVDEAHGFEGEARRQWAREFSGDLVRRGFEQLGSSKTGTLHNLMVQVSGLAEATLYQRLLTKLSASSARASVSCADFLLALHGLAGQADGSGDYDRVNVWIDARLRESDEWGSLKQVGDVCLRRLEEAEKDAREAFEALSEADAPLAGDLRASTSFLGQLGESLSLVLDGSDQSYFYSAELARRKRDMPSERLVAEKLEVGPDLAERWLSQMQSVVFTSATMAVGKSFEHFDHSVGLDALGPDAHRDLRLDSSFDYEDNMSVVVCKDMPQPNDPRYREALSQLLVDVHTAMGGSVLTLFTNRRDMELVYQQVLPRMHERGLELIMQERGASPRRLRDQFLADRSRSLFALRSFWEGFDAAGDTLRCVVIPKLPFASPKDPLVRERELREDRSWWRHSLPEAVISVKQAAGRLIRSSSDTGVLVLADSRLVSKRYGRQFTNSLPKQPPCELECGNVGEYIRMWRAGHES